MTALLSLLAPQGRVFDSFSDYLIEVIFVVALAGTLVAIAGLHVLQSGRYGLLGAAGSSIAFVGYALLLGGNLFLQTRKDKEVCGKACQKRKERKGEGG